MLYLLFPSIVLLGCDDGNKIIEIQNSLPTIEIQSHGDGTEFDEGYEVQFYAQASDLNHENEELQVAWYANDDLICDWLTPDPSGVTRCNIVMQTSMEKISVQVVDEAQGANRDEIAVVVNPTQPPQATIFSPQVNQTYYSDQLISFSAHISDAEDDAADLSVQWSSALDGDLSLDTNPDTSGQIEDFAYLTQGEHAIKLALTDTTGKVTTESVVISVRGDNVLPTCQISEPTDGSSSVVGETIVFRAVATDEDIANSELDIQWKSDKDGELGASTADSSGDVSFAFADLSNNTHTITLQVTDEVGGSCTDSILLTVGTPPTLQVQSPVNNDVYSTGEPVFFTAVVSDQEDLSSDLTVRWESSIDGVLPSIAPDSSGNISFNSSTLSAGLHSLSVIATDTGGLTATSNLSFRINTPPTSPTVAIDPTSPLTSETLSVNISDSTDADGDIVSYDYLWFESGIATSFTTSTLPSTATSVGQEWSVQVTPKDQYTSGIPTISNPVTVINSLPEVSNVQILPNPAYNDSVLTCSATVVDGDETLNADFEWNINGNIYSGSTFDLSSVSVQPQDSITCTATATDSLQAQDSESTSIMLSNRDPQIDSLTTSTSTALTNSELDCVAVASDMDGETPVVSYNWSVNGTTIGSQSTIVLTNNLVDVGDQLLCDVTVTDGYGGQDQSSLSWTIDNSNPTIDAITMTPQEPFIDSELLCEVVANDIDEDISNLNYTFVITNTTTNDVYTPIATGNQATLDLSTTNVQPEEEIECSASVYDSDSGSISDVQVVTVINKGPQFDSPATISPNSGIVVGTELICEATVTDYLDGSLIPEFRWLENGQEIVSGDTYTVDHSESSTGNFVGGSIVCEATAENSQGEITTSTDSVIVENSPPSVDSVVLIPNTGLYNDATVTCVTSVSDADGSVIPNIEWYVGNTNVGFGDELDLSTISIDPNDIIECRVTVDDGVDSDTDSASTSISNRDPVITDVSISPDPAYNSDILNCTATFEDIDGTVATPIYTWEDASSNSLGSGDSLDLSTLSLEPSDIVVCKVSVTDTIAVINDQTQIELGNRLPTIASVSITPDPAVVSDDLLCSYSGEQDADGDPISVDYAWSVGGIDQGVNSDTLPSGIFAKGQEVICSVTPFDTREYGLEVSDTIEISNAPPVITSLSISSTPAKTNDILTAVYSTDDIDNDSVNVDFIWVVDGSDITGQGDTLDGSVHFDKGQTVHVRAIPNDGFEDGLEVTSSDVIIENTAPSDPTLAISPSSPVVGIDPVYCEVTLPSSDDDLDSMTYSITWTKEGTSFSDVALMTTTVHSNDTILATATTEGETWECSVIVSDGTDNSNTVTASATIAPPFTGNGTWSTSTETLPHPSVNQSAILDEGNSRVLVFGGQQYYQLGSELLEYDLTSEIWSVITASGITPPALTEQASAYDASTGKWYLFGGQSYYYVSDELFTLDTTVGAETWSEWTGTTTPEPRKGGSAVFDDLTQKFYIIGGQGYYGLLDDIWSLDVATSTSSNAIWEEVIAGGTAPVRTESTATLDPDYGVIYLIGGQSYYQLAEDVTCFDLDTQTWMVASLTGDALPPMKGASSTWSDYIGGVIVTGGESYYRLIESVYVIRPSDACVAEVTEVNITSGSILPVYGGSLLHDSINREAILLGGQSYYQLSPNISNFTP